jgi:hypothetical protein
MMALGFLGVKINKNLMVAFSYYPLVYKLNKNTNSFNVKVNISFYLIGNFTRT